MSGRPAFDPDAAEENSARKGKLIGEFAHRLGVTFLELGALPYSSPDRKAPSLRRFAAAAFREAGVAENPPGKRTSDTWRHVREVMADLEDRERYGLDPLPRDLTGRRADWVRPALALVPDGEPDGMPAEIPAGVIACGPAGALPAEDVAAVVEFAGQLAQLREDHPRAPRPLDLVPYDAPPALSTSGAHPGVYGAPTGPPRGWAELAALGPLDPPRPCRWCRQPALVGTPNGWRCADHPPMRGDAKGDWGWALNWTPKPDRTCLATCYCGRCPHYDTTGKVSTGSGLRKDQQAHAHPVDGASTTAVVPASGQS